VRWSNTNMYKHTTILDIPRHRWNWVSPTKLSFVSKLRACQRNLNMNDSTQQTTQFNAIWHLRQKKCPLKNEESRKIRFLSFGGDVNYIQLQNLSLWGSSCVEIWSKQFLPAWRTHARTSVQLGVRAPLEQYFSYICVHHQNNFACPLWKIRFVRKCRVFLNSDVFPVL